MGGGASGTDATWGGGGVNGIGAGSGSTVIGALDFVAGDTLVASAGAIASVDGNRGLKKVDAKVTPMIPPTTK